MRQIGPRAARKSKAQTQHEAQQRGLWRGEGPVRQTGSRAARKSQAQTQREAQQRSLWRGEGPNAADR